MNASDIRSGYSAHLQNLARQERSHAVRALAYDCDGSLGAEEREKGAAEHLAKAADFERRAAAAASGGEDVAAYEYDRELRSERACAAAFVQEE